MSARLSAGNEPAKISPSGTRTNERGGRRWLSAARLLCVRWSLGWVSVGVRVAWAPAGREHRRARGMGAGRGGSIGVRVAGRRWSGSVGVRVAGRRWSGSVGVRVAGRWRSGSVGVRVARRLVGALRAAALVAEAHQGVREQAVGDAFD